MTAASTIQFSYAVGDDIEVRNDRGEGWHKAVVIKLEPYRGRPGYYVQNMPVLRSLSEGSAGGWVYERVMRKAEAEP